MKRWRRSRSSRSAVHIGENISRLRFALLAQILDEGACSYSSLVVVVVQGTFFYTSLVVVVLVDFTSSVAVVVVVV